MNKLLIFRNLEESEEAYKSIFRYVNQLVVSTVDMGHLQGTKKRRSNTLHIKNQRIKIEAGLYSTLTSQLWEEGTISSSFFPLKISMATKWHFAWPCFPVLEVETSTTFNKEGETIILNTTICTQPSRHQDIAQLWDFHNECIPS